MIGFDRPLLRDWLRECVLLRKRRRPGRPQRRIEPMRTAILAAVLAVLSPAAPSPAQTPPLPTRVEFSESDLRGLLPRDGELITQGRMSIDYIGVALGRQV